jgi:EPS-associated MarR family transcriptional regulator
MNDNKNDILNHEKTLYVIKELEHNPKITQRDLAQKLDISLGKINFLINALIDKGIIEAKNFKNSKNKLAYMYLLTPRGIRIKIEHVHKFLIWKTQEYKKLEQEIGRLKKESSFIPRQSYKEPSGELKDNNRLARKL